MIISVAAAQVKLVISLAWPARPFFFEKKKGLARLTSLGIYHSARNYHAANKEVRSIQFASKTTFEEKARE